MEKETSLKKMKLSIRQEDISTIAIANIDERKQLWEEWKRIHPDSQKRWKMENARDSDSLRCQAAVVIKKVSAKVEVKTYYQDLMNRSDGWSVQGSIQSDQSQDIENSAIFNRGSDTNQDESQDYMSDISIDPTETAWPSSILEEKVSTPLEHSKAKFTINPSLDFVLDNPGRGEETISKIYINDEILAEWSKENLTASLFPRDYPPIRALSETSRYEVKWFHTYIPEKLRESETEEEEFYDKHKPANDQLVMEDIKTEWITFLCQEELRTQADVDDHTRSSHAFDMSEIKNEYRINKKKISNLTLEGARNIKNLPESSLDKLLESWHDSAVANNMFIADQGRILNEIRPEKSAHLMKAISKTLEPETWNTFKINLSKKMEKEYDINKMFSCKWTEIEAAIKRSLGQAPNINRLIKCMEKENWEGLTLQQALHEINNFHNNNLKTQHSLYINNKGEMKEYTKNIDSAKICSATKLVKELPEKFDLIQFELQENLSNAYYETHESFEEIIEKFEKTIKHRGLNTLYTATKINIEKNLPTPIIQKHENENFPKINERIGRNLILQHLKTNKNLKGEITNDETLNCIIQQAGLCQKCLRRACKRKQRSNKENLCKETLNIIDYDKLIADLEESVLTYKTITKTSEIAKNKSDEIQPEDRFEDVTFQNPTDWEAFDNLAKNLGIPTLEDLEKGENYSAYMTEAEYITEPEPHPYQELLAKGTHNEIKEKLQTPAKEINNREIIPEKMNSTRKHDSEEKIQNKVTKKIDLREIKKQNMDNWSENKATTKNTKQSQNYKKDLICEKCHKYLVTERRIEIHKIICGETLETNKHKERKLKDIETQVNTEALLEIKQKEDLDVKKKVKIPEIKEENIINKDITETNKEKGSKKTVPDTKKEKNS
jgi:hypothetical protein